MLADRTLDGDIRRVRRLVEYSVGDDGSRLICAIEDRLGSELRRIAPLKGGEGD